MSQQGLASELREEKCSNLWFKGVTLSMPEKSASSANDNAHLLRTIPC